MSRTPRIYSPEGRDEFVENGLYCPMCGNNKAFSIDLKLKHVITPTNDGLLTELLEAFTNRVLDVIVTNLDKLIERGWEGRPVVRCANCGSDEELDLQGRIWDYCANMCCPGCWHCNSWIDESEVVELCTQCIQSKEGAIEEDDCIYQCDWNDSGLLEVLDHYGLTVNGLKERLGY